MHNPNTLQGEHGQLALGWGLIHLPISRAIHLAYRSNFIGLSKHSGWNHSHPKPNIWALSCIPRDLLGDFRSLVIILSLHWIHSSINNIDFKTATRSYVINIDAQCLRSMSEVSRWIALANLAVAVDAICVHRSPSGFVYSLGRYSSVHESTRICSFSLVSILVWNRSSGPSIWARSLQPIH